MTTSSERRANALELEQQLIELLPNRFKVEVKLSKGYYRAMISRPGHGHPNYASITVTVGDSGYTVSGRRGGMQFGGSCRSTIPAALVDVKQFVGQALNDHC